MLFTNAFRDISRLGVAFFGVMILSVAGCGNESNTTTSAKSATLTAIAITPASATLSMGETATFVAVATFSDGSLVDVTNMATWMSKKSAVAVVNRGVAAGSAVGTTVISAALNGVSSPDIDVTVTAAVLTAISIAPTPITIAKGRTAPLTATGIYSDGTRGNISGSVSWTSSNGDVAAVNAGGIASALALGSTAISASLNGIYSDPLSLSVTFPILTAIAITPGSATVSKGLTANLVATGTYSDGSVADVSGSVNWTAEAPAIASVGNTTGVVTGKALGSTTVSAYASGISSSPVTVTVTAAVLTSISVTPAGVSIAKGRTTAFTATGTYSDGTTGNVSGSVAWQFSDTVVAVDNGGGSVTGGAAGTSYVEASLSGATSNPAVLTVTPAVVTSIAIAAIPGYSVTVGTFTDLIATATYSDGSSANLPNVNSLSNWVSWDTSFVTVSQMGRVTGVGLGNGLVSVTADGVTKFVTVSVTP